MVKAITEHSLLSNQSFYSERDVIVTEYANVRQGFDRRFGH